MMQVTIEKIVSHNITYHMAVERVSPFKAGEVIKFNTAYGVITTVVATDTGDKCHDCAFFRGVLPECPTFKPNRLHGVRLLCNHYRCGDMPVYFKPLDSVLEEL